MPIQLTDYAVFRDNQAVIINNIFMSNVFGLVKQTSPTTLRIISALSKCVSRSKPLVHSSRRSKKRPNKRFPRSPFSRRLRQFISNTSKISEFVTPSMSLSANELRSYLRSETFLNNINSKHLKYSFGFICVKSSGINNFFTLTNSQGDVIGSLSSGLLKTVKRAKEKKSSYTLRYLGQLMAYKTRQCNFKYLFLRLDLIHLKHVACCDIFMKDCCSMAG